MALHGCCRTNSLIGSLVMPSNAPMANTTKCRLLAYWSSRRSLNSSFNCLLSALGKNGHRRSERRPYSLANAASARLEGALPESIMEPIMRRKANRMSLMGIKLPSPGGRRFPRRATRSAFLSLVRCRRLTILYPSEPCSFVSRLPYAVQSVSHSMRAFNFFDEDPTRTIGFFD
jgi:hypothetical protein